MKRQWACQLCGRKEDRGRGDVMFLTKTWRLVCIQCYPVHTVPHLRDRARMMRLRAKDTRACLKIRIRTSL